MQLMLALCLPRDASSIPVSRHVIRRALHEIGLTQACADDIALAQTEACTNVVKHSGPGDEYEVRLEVKDSRCYLSVVDTGRGFDWRSLEQGMVANSAERGRGIQLMRALVDEVKFASKPETGTIVHLEKVVELRDDAPILLLSRASLDPDAPALEV